MEYIRDPQTGIIDFDRYSAYLQTIRHKIPAHVYAFASDSRHFDLTSSSSLHDAWLESLTVAEPATGERGEIRSVEITLQLLGPFHDCRIHLRYTGLRHYCFTMPGSIQPEGRTINHGDLVTHEIRLAAENHLIHELVFETGATLLIVCDDILHSEEPVQQRREERA